MEAQNEVISNFIKLRQEVFEARDSYNFLYHCLANDTSNATHKFEHYRIETLVAASNRLKEAMKKLMEAQIPPY